MNMGPFSCDLYRADQLRQLDRIAIETFGIPGIELMNRAGCAAFERLRARWPGARRLAVLCGTGNNGGDGFIVARRAREAGLQVSLYQVGDESRLTGDALQARRLAQQLGVSPEPWCGQRLDDFELLVDGLLGTGLRGETVSEPWAEAITAMNESGVPVLALDIPSGLSADTGAPLGSAVRAHMTVTFIGYKQGLFTGEGPGFCGDVVLEKLRLPDEVYEAVFPAAILLTRPVPFAPRSRTAHKGDNGHLLIVGGDEGMSGAARLAGEAALRCGAGLVSIATRRSHAALINLTRPELMCHGIEDGRALSPLLDRADAVVVGPGLGCHQWGRSMLEKVLDSRLPLVVDADGLNLLADMPVKREEWILTPHPGEAARMLNSTPAAIQRDRFAAVQKIHRRYHGICVLKGAGTLILGPDGLPAVCGAGNPGMASGGMGDVLSGVLGALLAQGFGLQEAARQGVMVHAVAADRAVTMGERGLLASDLMVHLRKLVN